MAAIVASPGEKKSPALASAFEPLKRAQLRARDDHEMAQQAYRHEKLAYEAALAGYRDRARKGGAGGNSPEEPVEPRMRVSLVTDTTVEALARTLDGNPRGIALAADELAGWVLAMNQYRGGRGADRAHWLSIWAGATIVVSRRSLADPIIIPRPLVNVAGCLPPDLLDSLEDERGRDDGFLARILWAWPQPVPLRLEPQGIAPDIMEDYCELVDELFALQPSESGKPVELRLTAEGWDALSRFFTAELYPLIASAGPAIAGPYAKLEGYTARFALIIHLLRLVTGEVRSADVDAESVARAAMITMYFARHAELVAARLRSTESQRTSEGLIRWLQKGSNRPVAARDVQRAGVLPRSSTAAEISRYLDELAAGGVLERIEDKAPSGRDLVRYRLTASTGQNGAKPLPVLGFVSGDLSDMESRPGSSVGQVSGSQSDTKPVATKGLEPICRVSGDSYVPGDAGFIAWLRSRRDVLTRNEYLARLTTHGLIARSGILEPGRSAA